MAAELHHQTLVLRAGGARLEIDIEGGTAAPVEDVPDAPRDAAQAGGVCVDLDTNSVALVFTAGSTPVAVKVGRRVNGQRSDLIRGGEWMPALHRGPQDYLALAPDSTCTFDVDAGRGADDAALQILMRPLRPSATIVDDHPADADPYALADWDEAHLARVVLHLREADARTTPEPEPDDEEGSASDDVIDEAARLFTEATRAAAHVLEEITGPDTKKDIERTTRRLLGALDSLLKK